MNKIYPLIALVFVSWAAHSQHSLYTLGDDYNYHIIDRLQVQDDSVQFFTSFKPYNREEIVDLLAGEPESGTDGFNQDYLLQEHWEQADSHERFFSKKPFFKKIYRSRSDLFHHYGEDLDFHVNPVLYFRMGKDSEMNELVYTNTRGVEVRGTVDNKVSFYTAFTENQLRYPSYIREYQTRNGAIPGLGFWKLLGDNAYDFIQARGHIAFNATKHINLQFGHDRFFIGNGYRSMLLSDFSNYMPFFKIQTKVWKLQYTNLYTQLVADVDYTNTGTIGVNAFPKKFMATHHLSMNITKKLNVGLFETIIFSREDSLGNNTFEWNYLNPIILYRSVEQLTGSPDNALLGLDLKYQLLEKTYLYGQFLIDEFIVSNVLEDKGNWTNKFGYQVGLKHFDIFGIDNLDIQLEHNFARPYTYTHQDFYTNYTHYNQPLAHPLGANFKEFIGIIRYQPIPRLYGVAKLIYFEKGLDLAGENYGGNILLSYTDRTPAESDNFVGQGLLLKQFHADFKVSYQLKHNLFIDFQQIVRKGDTNQYNQNESFTSLGIRLNIASTDIVL